jgi:hypothetical protein
MNMSSPRDSRPSEPAASRRPFFVGFAIVVLIKLGRASLFHRWRNLNDIYGRANTFGRGGHLFVGGCSVASSDSRTLSELVVIVGNPEHNALVAIVSARVRISSPAAANGWVIGQHARHWRGRVMPHLPPPPVVRPTFTSSKETCGVVSVGKFGATY